MDHRTARTKPALPPKPSINVLNKCKSASCMTSSLNQSSRKDDQTKHFSESNRRGSNGLSPTTSPENIPPNEDVFSNSSNNNRTFATDRQHRPQKSHSRLQRASGAIDSRTLPLNVRESKFGGGSNRSLYRSGGTMKITKNGTSFDVSRPNENSSDVLSPLDQQTTKTPERDSLDRYIPLVVSAALESSESRCNINNIVDAKPVDVNNNNNKMSESNVDRTESDFIARSPYADKTLLKKPPKPAKPANFVVGKVAKLDSVPDLLAIRPTSASPLLAASKGRITSCSTKVSSASSHSSETKETTSDAAPDDLDVLIPAFADASAPKRPAGQKSKPKSVVLSVFPSRRQEAWDSSSGQDRGRSVPRNFGNRKVEEETRESPDSEAEHPKRRSKSKLPASIFYMPMDRVKRDGRRKFVLSSNDLVAEQERRRMRMKELMSKCADDDPEGKQDRARTLHWTANLNETILSPTSTSSSLSNLDAFSPDSSKPPTSTIGAPDGEEREAKSRHDVSDDSDDNYGTLSDIEYMSRDDMEEKDVTLSSSVESPRDGSASNDADVSDVVEVDDDDKVNDELFDRSGDDDDGGHEMLPSDGKKETNNEIKTLVLPGDAGTIDAFVDPRLPCNDFASSFFISSSISSAASSMTSLNFSGSFGSSFRSASADAIAGGDDSDCVRLADEEGRLNKSDTAISYEKEDHAVNDGRKDPFLVAKEIVSSEETFIGVLKLLNEDFPNFIQSERAQGRATDGPADPRHLIRDLPNLQEVNKELLNQLKQRIENWDRDPRMADIFVRTGHFLKLYTSYIKNFSLMVQELDNTRRKCPEFDRAVAEFETTPTCNKLALKHYMLKPIQRIPQYKLLLQEYLKCLSPNSPDYENAKEAIPIVAGVSEHANESVREWENQSKMIHIQSTLLGGYQVVKPGRKFIKEGRLLKLSRKEMQSRMFFLFNNCLLYTTPAGTNMFKVNQDISLDGLTVSCPATEDIQNEFSIISVQRSFTVMASSKEERQQWVAALESTVADFKENKASLEKRQSGFPFINFSVRSPGNGSLSRDVCDFKVGDRAPVWIQDDRASMCMTCAREFSVTFRRHHCRGCGKIVCSNCSRCRAPLRYSGYKPARVCGDCYERLKTDLLEVAEDNPISSSVSECGRNASEDDKVSGTLPPNQQPAPFSKRNLTLLFKGRTRNTKDFVGSPSKPSILTEVQAFDSKSELNGFLLQLEKKKWRKFWFVLKSSVLYTFKAMQDKAALRTMPLLSYLVQDGSSGVDSDEKTFEIYHDGLPPITLRAETCTLKFKWIDALRKAMIV